MLRDGKITTRGTRNDDAWVYSEQGPHPCVSPSYTYAVLLINRRESGGTFRRGYEFVIEDVSAYERHGEYIVDIELDSRVARTLRVVSSEPLVNVQLHQLVGSSLRGIAGGYFNLELPKTRYYE